VSRDFVYINDSTQNRIYTPQDDVHASGRNNNFESGGGGERIDIDALMQQREQAIKSMRQ
jgi:hypothetical protein